jgi:hypothetical protein
VSGKLRSTHRCSALSQLTLLPRPKFDWFLTVVFVGFSIKWRFCLFWERQIWYELRHGNGILPPPRNKKSASYWLPDSYTAGLYTCLSPQRHVKYLGVIFDEEVTWRLHIETIAAKALRIFISIYPLLKSERLSVGTKLTLYKVFIRSILTYAWPAWEFTVESNLLKLQRLQNSSPHHWKSTEAHINTQFTSGVSNSLLIWFRYKIIRGASKSHTQSWKCQYSYHWPGRGSSQKV